MSDKSISISEAYKFGWSSVKTNIGYFIKIFAVILTVYIALIAASYFTGIDRNPAPDVIITLINSIFEIVITIGLIKIAITFTRGDKPLVSDVFSSYRLFFKFFFSTILNTIIIFVGLLLFIIPGVIWSLKFSQYKYLIVDKKMGPVEALKESSKLTKGAKWELLGFFIITFLVNVLGIIFFVVGILITAPITMLATAHVYQQLLNQEKPQINETSTSAPTPTPPPTPAQQPNAPTPPATESAKTSTPPPSIRAGS